MLDEARGLTHEPDPAAFIPELQRLCARIGVAVVFTRELPGTHVSGATRWLNKDTALIQLSLRYKSDDHLWFTFFHEAGHIIKHGKKELFLESEEIGGDQEKEADIFASNVLIPRKEFRALVRSRRFSRTAIVEFANQLGIAPGIVVGQLQHHNWIPYTHLNGLK